MMVLFIGTVVWAIYFDTMKPNPGLTAHPAGQTYEVPSASAPGGKRQVTIPAVAGLPVDQHLGNLEGKELRFGTSAGAAWGAITTDATCGAINAEQDSLNPLAGLSPMVGVWLNCIFGGKGAIDEQSFGSHHPRVATNLNNLALLLKSTDRLEEAEALYRRALAIDEQNFGSDHPNVGSDLNNLAALLEATDRLDEAEQLMRLMLGVFLRSSASTGRQDPFLKTGVRNYAALLADMGRSPAQIISRLTDLARPFGINFGSGALSEIARQSQKRRTAPWSSVLSGYFTTLTSPFRKVAALLARKNRAP